MGVLAGERYWRQVFNMDFLVEEGIVDAEDRELFWFVETAQDIWTNFGVGVRLSGESLFRLSVID